MKSMVRLLLLVLPIVALSTFLFVRSQLGGIAPAPPDSTTTLDAPTLATPRTAQLQPTVLEPAPNSDGTSLPPGMDPTDLGSDLPLRGTDDDLIPISDLQPPAALLEFPAPPAERLER